MGKITEEMVRHVAYLSRLEFNDEQIKNFTKQLNNILEYMDKLNELDTSNVEPTSHSVNITNVFREDRVEQPLSVEDALANAPEKEADCFKVPKIIHEY
ncbi:Asp-tRNA(Asn)/Glu-tRNA(Gln) amidotransferase subunit GatC [Candidatus Sumerlaeota bacterium]|nr:Asp-tRNA(Asn)/Glu-tRNA(Gln) amidotransferase subunit GatC [Candidatus Sumerlaeota bacterium]